MKYAILALSLAACAHQPPPHVMDAHNKIAPYFTYKNELKPWYVYPRPHQEFSGNCLAYAMGMLAVLNEDPRTGKATLKVCRHKTQGNHAMVLVDGWALDNMYSMPVEESVVLSKCDLVGGEG